MSDDLDFIVKLAGCSLAKTPGKDNWVDESGGLPEAICEMAKDIRDGGKDTSSAIAIAVSQAKKLAATSKDPKVRAKYSKAVAEWEKMKAKSHAKSDAKGAVKMSSPVEKIVALSAGFNTPVGRVSEASVGLTRKVASESGVRKFHKPIGSPIPDGTSLRPYTHVNMKTGEKSSEYKPGFEGGGYASREEAKKNLDAAPEGTHIIARQNDDQRSHVLIKKGDVFHPAPHEHADFGNEPRTSEHLSSYQRLDVNKAEADRMAAEYKKKNMSKSYKPMHGSRQTPNARARDKMENH